MKAEVTRFDRPLVVGSGLAGIMVALELGRVVVVSDSEMGSSWWSQGGLAAALSPEDSPVTHGADTRAAAGGIGDPEAIEALTSGAPAAIDKLTKLGIPFDRDLEGDLLLGQERGHSWPRIVRSDGDATGAELMGALISTAKRAEGIDLLNGRVLDLVSDGERVSGVVVTDGTQRHVFIAPAVILATGGLGRLYARTTSPEGIGGGGVAIASRAGAILADLEFVRFHPTALWIGKDPLPVLPDGLLQEGAALVDGSGRPFVSNVAALAESSSSDALAQVVYSRCQDESPVYMDVRPVPSFEERFPTPTAHAVSVGLDPREHLLPVSSAAHLSVGGVKVDSYGRTSLPGLWAVGECSSTGIHGAMGLEANSMLEAVVFGMRAAESVQSEARIPGDRLRLPEDSLDLPVIAGPAADELRQIMWDHVGPVRTAAGMQDGESALRSMEAILNRTIEGRNAFTLALMAISAAERRTESRGAHYRVDHPAVDPSQQSRNEMRPPVPEWIDLEALDFVWERSIGSLDDHE